MKIAWKAAVAAGVAFVASPANAADWRYCMTVVKDGGGKDRIAIFSPTFDATISSAYASEWESRTRPVAENALDQHLTSGTVKVACQTIPQARSVNESHRARHVAMARRQGVLVEEFQWSPGQSNLRSAGGSQSDSGSREDEVAAANDSSSSGSSSSSSGSTKSAETKEEPLRRIGADYGSPPPGYSDWERHYRGDYVNVDYAYKASKDEVRVVWRCTNESNRDMSCSIGAGGDKEYQCWNGNTTLGSTRMSGERATVRAGRNYTFPSDWACRGKGATSVAPITRISIES